MALLLAAHVGLLALGDLAARPLPTLGWLALGFVGLFLADMVSTDRLFPRAPGSDIYGLSSRRLGFGGVIAVAVLLRLLMAPLAPTLSDDVYRYVWDGTVVGAGANPYLLAPESPELTDLRDELWEGLPHRDVPTVYPPLAMAVFSIAARTPRPVATLKAIFILVDLVACWLLLVLLRDLRVPVERAVWYAWNPLVTLEIAGMAHVDVLGVAAVLLVVVCLTRRPVRSAVAGLGAALGVLAKLVPVVAVPLWARASHTPSRFLVVAVGLAAAGLAPLVVAAGGVPPGLVRYGVSWEFNGPFFEPLWRLLALAGVPEVVAGALDALKEWTGEHEFWNHLYPYNYPQFEAKLLLGVGLLVALMVTWRRVDPVTATGLVFGHVILFSATVYPWYLLWVLPFAAISRHPAWLTLSASILLSYLPQTTETVLFPWVFLAIWLPFFVLLGRSRWSS